ncbi:unnamed protein product [Sphenostylis stenocarpa]|uniref:Uncharacterized protein n=1 Tax=Sphenostylis stenocarpa TaxID=92480 RepID=A0AA86SZZ1_9FABA|nr:unnamed protein product [Sphenostylis stenocarpa]
MRNQSAVFSFQTPLTSFVKCYLFVFKTPMLCPPCSVKPYIPGVPPDVNGEGYGKGDIWKWTTGELSERHFLGFLPEDSNFTTASDQIPHEALSIRAMPLLHIAQEAYNSDGGEAIMVAIFIVTLNEPYDLSWLTKLEETWESRENDFRIRTRKICFDVVFNSYLACKDVFLAGLARTILLQ